jgi:hypothetical protein
MWLIRSWPLFLLQDPTYQARSSPFAVQVEKKPVKQEGESINQYSCVQSQNGMKVIVIGASSLGRLTHLLRFVFCFKGR